ncbi:MAG: hypothetical protein Q4A42_01945 [Tissierellia bacterium]|nr:hypothetical protein [Tissierellia bacterium]
MNKKYLIKDILSLFFISLIIFNTNVGNSYASNSFNKVIIEPMAPGDYGTYITFGNRKIVSRINSKFVGYAKRLTPYWTKSKEYHVNSGTSLQLEASVSYKGIVSLSLSYSHTIGATTVIPANSSKFSKLAVYDDFRVVRESVYIHENGIKRFLYYSYKLERIPNQTSLRVRYR